VKIANNRYTRSSMGTSVGHLKLISVRANSSSGLFVPSVSLCMSLCVSVCLCMCVWL